MWPSANFVRFKALPIHVHIPNKVKQFIDRSDISVVVFFLELLVFFIASRREQGMRCMYFSPLKPIHR